jgi:hypothetical protein
VLDLREEIQGNEIFRPLLQHRRELGLRVVGLADLQQHSRVAEAVLGREDVFDHGTF